MVAELGEGTISSIPVASSNAPQASAMAGLREAVEKNVGRNRR